MSNEASFDISSTVDLQEVDNAVQQVTKEIQQRFDFKGSASRVTRDEQGLLLYADDATSSRLSWSYWNRSWSGERSLSRRLPMKLLSRRLRGPFDSE